MRIRRLLLLAITAVLASIVVTALLAPVEPDSGPATDSRSAPSGADDRARAGDPGSSSEPGGEAAGVEVISAGRTDQRVRLAVGQALRLQVESEEPVGVQLGEDGPVEYAAPGAPAEFALFGRRGLDEPVTLLESELVIGRVTAARPR